MIIWDFNNVFIRADIIGGKDVHPSEYSDMADMIGTVGLTEHETIENHFTWSNKHSTGMIYSMIDRSICNTNWFQHFPHCDIEVLHPHISDHAPLKIHFDISGPIYRTPVGFKFLNYITEKIDYLQVIHESWKQPEKGRSMYILWRKLGSLQAILRKYTKTVTVGARKIQHGRDNLEKARHVGRG